MRVCALALVVGCSYEPPEVGAPDDAREPADDSTTAADVAADTVSDSADPDPVLPSTTNHPSVADTFLGMPNPDTNFNDQTSALADLDGRVALFRFDLSAIPTTAVIDAVELHIWADTDPGLTCDFYQVLEPWTETGATWNSRATGLAWSSPGAAPPSRGTASYGTVVPSTASTEYVVTIDPTIVRAWVSTPASNLGFAIVSSNTDGARFSTREHAISARRPYLRVTHTP